VRVGLDGNCAGANRGTSYLWFPIEAGEHHFCVDWQAKPFRISSRMMAPASLTGRARTDLSGPESSNIAEKSGLWIWI